MNWHRYVLKSLDIILRLVQIIFCLFLCFCLDILYIYIYSNTYIYVAFLFCIVNSLVKKKWSLELNLR